MSTIHITRGHIIKATCQWLLNVKIMSFGFMVYAVWSCHLAYPMKGCTSTFSLF